MKARRRRHKPGLLEEASWRGGKKSLKGSFSPPVQSMGGGGPCGRQMARGAFKSLHAAARGKEALGLAVLLAILGGSSFSIFVPCNRCGGLGLGGGGCLVLAEGLQLLQVATSCQY